MMWQKSMGIGGRAVRRAALALAIAGALATVAQAQGTGAGAGDTDADKQAELARKALNPIASLISLPIQGNWDYGIGTTDATKLTVNVQPVVPVSLSETTNLILRTVVPIIDAPASSEGGSDHSGLGDILQSWFFSPKKPVGGWIMGAGPAILYPSATDGALGAGKWGAGPTFLMLQQSHGFTYGLLANHVWSFAGQSRRASVSASFVQPFLSYTTKTFTTLGVNTESSYDWQTEQWLAPLNVTLTQLLKVGKQPFSLLVGYRHFMDAPDGGPDSGLRVGVTLLFP